MEQVAGNRITADDRELPASHWSGALLDMFTRISVPDPLALVDDWNRKAGGIRTGRYDLYSDVFLITCLRQLPKGLRYHPQDSRENQRLLHVAS